MADTLKNLQYMTINKGMKHIIGGDKMSHFPDMRIQDDSTLYAKLLGKKRSTFDLSKFTVVGSPTITDDGVASGFNTSNYIYIDNADLIIKKPQQNYKICMQFNTGDDIVSYNRTIFSFVGNDVTASLFHTFIRPSGHLGVEMFHPDSTKSLLISNIALDNNTEYIIEVSQNESNIITARFRKTNSNEWSYLTIQDSEQPTFIYDISKYNCCIGYSLHGSAEYYRNIIDLKQFSITVDGKEVFNGNKTGIDQIKKDDFTKYGNVTISADGIAYSDAALSNNAIEAPVINLASYKTWKIVGKAVRETSSVENYLLTFASSNGPALALTYSAVNGSLFFRCNTDEKNVANQSLSFNPVIGKEFYYEISFDGNHIYVKLGYEENKYLRVTYYATTHNVKTCITTSIMGRSTSNNYQWIGYHDLNYFKIYGDDQLVYQPTLRIPYTQSKTDEKIVDAVYRSRVQDMHEQFGYTHYYTIGDTLEDYHVEVFGRPTLVGGIASNFVLHSSFVAISNFISLSKMAEKEFKINFAGILPPKGVMNYLLGYDGGDDSGIMVGNIYSNNNFVFKAITTDGYKQCFNKLSDSCFGKAFDGYCEYKNKKFNLVLKFEHEDFIRTASVDSDTGLAPFNTRLYIGDGYNASVNLAKFSLEIEDKEVWRGYEPAITDAFTLATHKGTDVIESYSDDEGTYYEVRADLVQRCVGQIPVNTTEVTYPREFRDDKNIVQVAYFNVGESTATPTIAHIAPKVQTKSGFTIGAATNLPRNYYAEGKAVLG